MVGQQVYLLGEKLCTDCLYDCYQASEDMDVKQRHTWDQVDVFVHRVQHDEVEIVMMAAGLAESAKQKRFLWINHVVVHVSVHDKIKSPSPTHRILSLTHGASARCIADNIEQQHPETPRWYRCACLGHHSTC